MKIRQILTGYMAALLATTLVLTGSVVTATPAVADDSATPSIALNGTVSDSTSGYLTSKSVIMSSGAETKINYRLVPSYATGAATGVRVTLFLPSLEAIGGGEFQVVPRDAAPTPMGVQGRVSSGGEWIVVSDTTVKGGPLVLEYDGDLRAGGNPAFDVFVSTYDDGSTGAYGGVPEGTTFEINGYVTYEMFNRVEGSSWETPKQLDNDSRVSVIASDLKWEPTIAAYGAEGGSTAVPMWDRYQYFDYVYTLENVSTNPASNIDGYSVTFDIDTTDNINGIIPFDINRFQYVDGEAVANADPDHMEGQFIGVPEQGGVLIYDITDWDGQSELTDELPYSYSGAGMIILNREHGADKQGLTPGVNRTYMVKLPMSRQGFPNLPTNFKLTAITNILFAKTANWTKTRTAVREVTTPTYGLDFTHTPEKASVVEGTETYTQISGITSASNAPVFDGKIRYTVAEKFNATHVVYEVDQATLAKLGEPEISYVRTDKNGNEVPGVLTGSAGATDPDTGITAITFDISTLGADKNLTWARELVFEGLFERLNPGAALGLTIKVYGAGPTTKLTDPAIGTLTHPAVAIWQERFASNVDYASPTEYTNVERTTQKDATFEIVKPKPQDVLKPVVGVIGIYGDRRTDTTTQVPYEAPFQAEYRLSTTGVDAATFTYTIEAGKPSSTGQATPTKITLTEAFLAAASDITITLIDEDGDETTTADTEVVIPENVASIVISGVSLNLASATAIALVDYDSSLVMGSSQQLKASFEGQQVPPDTATRTATKTNTVTIPETKTAVETEGLNQVTRPQGAGNAYDQWVDRLWYCNTSGCGSKTDYTLDQGYKSLGGFASTITRPTETYTNNDQVTTVDVTFPDEQFDMYYMKIRDDVQPYLRSIDVYRTVDGTEQLWKTIDAADWVANTAEGNFWRIATADPDATDLYATFASVTDEGHTYYKDAFADDVVPTAPVSKVVLTLDFERESANALPQLKGTTTRFIEYMGRFYETSEEGKKLTSATTVDTFGTKAEITRTATSTPIYSLVNHPFAQTRTGAQDSTGTAKKTVSMGTEANFLASIWNVNNASWYYYNGHGPDVYSPVWTEFDEWLYHYDPASFHDRMSYHFTYPANPNKDADYNFQATQLVLPNTSTLGYLTELRIDFDNTTSQTLTVDAALRERLIAAGGLHVVYDSSLAAGFHENADGSFSVSAGAGVHPLVFEAFFEEIDGFGDNTAELKGVTGDTLGANLNEIDVKVGGIVNGNKDLVGTTRLYREPADSARTLMHTTSATLLGATPTLGASMDMSFDAMSVYDYAADGITPNTTMVQAGMANTAQADISAFTMTLALDANFRGQKVEIPAAVFNQDWETKSVTLTQPGGTVEVDLDRFTLNADTGRYELDLIELFDDGTLTTTKQTVTFGGTSELEVQPVSSVVVKFSAKRDAKGDPVTRMWGSFAREADPSLSARMIAGSYLFVTGDWVDETPDGHGWDSKPSFRSQGTKVSTGSILYSSFTASAGSFETPQRFTANAGGGNSGMNPSYRRYDGQAPVVRHRLSQMQLHGMHLNEDLSKLDNSRYLFDADTGERIASGNMVVGDTAKVLYELRNSGAAGSEYLPIFSPSAHFTAPTGMDIAKVTVVRNGENAALDATIAATGRTSVQLTEDRFTVTEATADKRFDVLFTDVTVGLQESVFVLVEYVAVNDYSAQLGDTQAKTVYPYSYARPGYQHHIQNYVVSGVSANGVTGADSAAGDYDGDGVQEHLARVHTGYTFSNPNDLTTTSSFDGESVSGTALELKLSKISNEIIHSNTGAVLDITLDTRARGFELTKLPEPSYPAGFAGEFDEPKVYIRVDGDWVTYDKDRHDLGDVNEIRVDYGILPARDGNAAEFALPDFSIVGKAHWQGYGGAGTKSSQITSQATLTLTHHDGSQSDNPGVASYKVTDTATLTVYKALPRVEFNLQSFDTAAEADAPYTDASATQVGKTSYLPGDDVHMKLTARNGNTAKSANTGLGKAPLQDPVIIDRLPEYISTPLSDYVDGGKLDVASAIADGILTIRHFDKDGALRTDVTLPEVTVATVTGLDVGGAQSFANDRKNDAFGLLSSAEPMNTAKNRAETVEFTVFTYAFGDDLGRGERIEVMYAGEIRQDDLPYATYADGHEVFAPLMGWYSGNNPTAGNMHQYDMDMAALLHDAGITGTRGHEMTSAEFLSQSFSWQSGSNTERRHPGASSTTQETYYDASANSMYSHLAYLHETTDSRLFEAATAGEADDNFTYVTTARVGGQKGPAGERILWAQDNLQLKRAWLYGASEMLPDTQRKASGQDPANFYEFDGSLKAPDYGLTPYSVDSYVYAVQLHEQFTVRLHSANLGDRPIESGIEYLETLPVGITPYDEDGELLGVTAYDGAGNAIPEGRVTIDVVQTPDNDKGYTAPAQKQEAGTYKTDVLKDAVPYVIRVTVAGELGGMFHQPTSTLKSKYQYVDVRVQVEDESTTLVDGKFYWYDELTVTTIKAEEYLAVYDHSYGALHRAPHSWNPNEFPNDGMKQGFDLLDLSYSYSSYTSYFSMEPYGMYISGINSQGTTVKVGDDEKPGIVNGDSVAMRQPTLRVWNNVEKDAYTTDYDNTLQNLTVDLYEEFTVHAIVENQQVEVHEDHFTGNAYTDNRYTHAPQTTGGARGTWFDPTVTVTLPSGIRPVLEGGDFVRSDEDLADQQDVAFTARISDVTYKSSTALADVSEHLNVKVERIEDGEDERYVLHFTAKDTAAAKRALHEIAFGQSLTVSPRVRVIDVPNATGDATPAEASKYQQIITLANSERPSFKAVVVAAKPTGSVPSGATADRQRLDSTSTWSNNMGVQKVTERLISGTHAYAQGDRIALRTGDQWKVEASELTPDVVSAAAPDNGAYGGTCLVLRQPTIVNTTKAGLYADGTFVETQLVDSAGKFWVSTDINNRAASHANPYEEIKAAGDVHHARFVVSSYITAFAQRIGEPVLVVDGDVLDRTAFEALGYSVKMLTKDERKDAGERQLIQWLVTTPAGDNGTRGELASGQNVTLRHQLQLVDGFTENDDDTASTWKDASLAIDSYISLVTDDVALIEGGQREDDFIVQNPAAVNYETQAVEATASFDIDKDGETDGVFAQDAAEIEIIKPRGEVRVNTTRPRLLYTGGLTGDPYFNSSDTIEYLVTYAKNTGSGLKQMSFEHALPSHESNDPDTQVSVDELETTLLYVTSGTWELPASTLDRLAQVGKTVDEVFETEVYVSKEITEAGYEGGAWVSLGKSSILTNTQFDLPAEDRLDHRKVRVVVRSLDDDFLVPTGTRLAVDADPGAPGAQEVTQTDANNDSVTVYPPSVTDYGMKIGMRAASERKGTLFIYDTVQMWGNYVADTMMSLDQSVVRSYLTPSRPVVNVYHDALYYRSDATQPIEQRYGWSDNTTVNPEVSPHLKFHGEVVNADESMWNSDREDLTKPYEGDTYSEDTLIDPVVTFELPKAMTLGEAFRYVPADQVDATHPLSDDHRTRYSLTDEDAHLWTWKLVRSDGTEASADSYLTHTDIYTGPWAGMDRNVVTVWFEGMVYPGDKIVLDFIGKVDAYTPGASSTDLESTVYVTNSTGLLQPLNSDRNADNKLGYITDRYDLDDNELLNDRLVFAQRSLFSYETYDNFSKRKVSYSDLNRAGTVWPQATPVREGGSFTYQLTLDNTNAAPDEGRPDLTAYPYPIMYDVLPYAGDTTIMNGETARNSMGSSLLDLDSITLTREGATPKTYSDGDFTTFVGPFTMQDGKVVETTLLPSSEVSTQAFYDSLGVVGSASAVREANFVTLAQFRAAVAADPALLGKARAVLTMFNNADATLGSESKLKLTYRMTAPLNAPVYLETWQSEGKPGDVAQWNSFVGTQRKEDFKPQESNNAGTYVTEKAESVSIGNYVWHDANFNATQDEGEQYRDVNGRELLKPTKDIDFDGTIDDPGINGVKVTLLSPNGRSVDYAGNAIVQDGKTWVVVDDETGEIVKDDLGQTTASDGPLVTTTRTDVNGFAGYYVFSNITPGDYRVMFEFPKGYERFSVTTQKLISGAGVTVYEPGVAADIPVAHDKSALVAITSVETITTETVDDVRMGFDVGVGQLLTFGGVIWNDENRDGLRGAREGGLKDYTVVLKDAAGKVVLDVNGEKQETVSAADGSYSFTVLPRPGQYRVEVVHPGGTYDVDMPVTPILRSYDPFAAGDDNDGHLDRRGSERIVTTNVFSFDQASLYAAEFADRKVVNVGFYERQETAVIGNRVWDDLNRDGIQDADEPGVEGQELVLEQYERKGDAWVKNTAFEMRTASGADGYYAFINVPVFRGEDDDLVEYRYQVVVQQLKSGYNFGPVNAGDDAIDSDFHMNGRMHAGAVGDHLIALMEMDGTVPLPVDDITIDLGLIAHATGVIAGEVFVDAEPDGVKTGDDLAAERYTATLQVSADGVTWTDVASQQAVNAYRFDGLAVYDEAARVANQYRVVVTEIPLWLEVTEYGVGDDGSDSDFLEVDRAGTATAVSDTYTLAEPVTGHLLPIDTRTAISHEDVDLGLVEPAATIGGRVWEDADQDGIQGDGEPGITGQTVTLWEKVDGAWVVVDDLRGDSTTVTGADGRYTFRVAPTHYDQTHPLFLQPREYRVTSDRQGYQVWSPALVGDDRTVDSDMVEGDPETGPLHRAYSQVFAIADVVGGRLVAGAVRDDLEMDMGIKTHPHLVTIGGEVWDDQNEDGVQQDGEPTLAGREITLWEKIDGEWQIATDVNGDSVVTTDARGAYAFVVEPTHYDETHEGYFQPREYRTTAAMPDGYRLSTGEDVTAQSLQGRVVSLTAQILTVDGNGHVLLTELSDDFTLDFPVVKIVLPGLAFTGGQLSLLLPTLALGLLSLGLVLVLIRRRGQKTSTR